MHGQWTGTYGGTNSGNAVMELDLVRGHNEGHIYIWDDRLDLPPMSAFVRILENSKHYSNPSVVLTPLDGSGNFTDWASIAAKYPGVIAPTSAETDWTIGDDSIEVAWKTNIGTNGIAHLKRVDGNRPSELEPISTVISWDEFRKYVRTLKPRDFVFRGQESNKWRLRTAFHRTDRSDLVKFLRADVAALHQALSTLTTHLFDLSKPIEHAAFVSLAQHHGYPTPLLDWTYSPFIAAYFAFKKRVNTDADKVRIFVFDHYNWTTDWQQLSVLQPARLHFSILHAIAVNNVRLIPQQALSSVTNTEDIEEYLAEKALMKPGRKYLQAIDLPVSDREEALTELSMMGIDAGSLFPGLDGACQQMKDRLFGV